MNERMKCPSDKLYNRGSVVETSRSRISAKTSEGRSLACSLSVFISWVLCALTLLTFAACGRTAGDLSLGEWQAVGTREPPPADSASAIEITQLAPGTGRIVGPGDLVKVRITPKGQAIAEELSIIESLPPWDVWLWVGREPNDHKTSINFGNANLRAALIGRSVQEQLSIQLAETAQKYVHIPLEGGNIVGENYEVKRYIYEPDDRRLRSWPELLITRAGSIDLEILNSCPAQLYHREGILTQHGKAIQDLMGDGTSKWIRTIKLGWSLLKASCPDSEGAVKLEVGPAPYLPIYSERSREHIHFADWIPTYLRLRPFRQFPQEYESDKVFAREFPRRQTVETRKNEQLTDCDKRQEYWADPYPRLLPRLTNAEAIFGIRYATIRTKDGQIRNWYPNKDCYEHVPVINRELFSEPGLRGIVSVAAQGATGFALTKDGALWSWAPGTPGTVWYPKLPDDAPDELKHDKRYRGSAAEIAEIAPGIDHVLVRTKTGIVWSWGGNDCGQLGRGKSSDVLRDSALPVTGLPPVIAIAAGNRTSFALAADGSVWSWGYEGPFFDTHATRNFEHCGNKRNPLKPGEPGYSISGEPDPQPVPKKIPLMNDIIAISAAHGRHALALKRDGTVWAWGENSCGELGVENNPNDSYPFQKEAVQVEGLRNIRAVAAGYRYSLALRRDGKVWSWGHVWYEKRDANKTTAAERADRDRAMGSRERARLYNGPPRRELCESAGVFRDASKPRPVPEIVPEVQGVIAIATGDGTGLGLTKDGRVWGWGSPVGNE